MTERDILDAFSRMPARREPRTDVLSSGRRVRVDVARTDVLSSGRRVRVDVARTETAPATPRPIVRTDTEEYEVVFSGRGFLDGRGLSHAGGGSTLAGTHQVLARRTGEARRA